LNARKAYALAEWIAARRCSKSVIGWPCTRPKKHTGGCAYSLKKFDWLVARWKSDVAGAR
jgi:hypothetical protein